MALPPSNLPLASGSPANPSGPARPIAPPPQPPRPATPSVPPLAPPAPASMRPQPASAPAIRPPVPPPAPPKPSAPAPGVPPRPVPPPAPSGPKPGAQINVMPPRSAPAPVGKKGEPEDIFSDLEQPAMKKAGDRMMPPSGPMTSGGGGMGKFLMIGGIVVAVIAVLAFGFWFFVIRSPKVQEPAQVMPEGQMDTFQLEEATTGTETPAVTEPTTESVFPGETSIMEAAPSASGTGELPALVTTPPAGTNVPLPESIQPAQELTPTTTVSDDAIDTDADGLSDRREKELGTEVANADSDNDSVKDGDEVLKFGTNPLNPDTDGDGFTDGVEIKNGYNPRGSGKCVKLDCSL